MANKDQRCIGAATSSSPAGPFTPFGDAPLLCPESVDGTIDTAIDPAGFIDHAGGEGDGDGEQSESEEGDTETEESTTTTRKNKRSPQSPTPGNCDPAGSTSGKGKGKPYLLYRHRHDNRDRIMLQQLSPSGLEKAGGAAATLIESTAQDGWVTEAPSLAKTRKGGYVLFYSTHGWDTDKYTVSIATSPTLKPGGGGYERKGNLLDTPKLRGVTGGGQTGPGGAGVIKGVPPKKEGDPPTQKEVWGLVLHAAKAGKIKERQMWTAGVEVGGEGGVKLVGA